MKNKFLITSIIFLSAIGFISCGDSEGSENKNASPKEKESSVYVQVEKMNASPYTDYISVIGKAEADKKANLGSEEGGKIKSFPKSRGSFVSAGEVIVIMDNDVLKAQMEAAKAQYDRTESNFQKQEKIYNQNVTSELEFLNAKYERDAAKANYELMKSRYDKTFIKAPFSGTIEDKFFEHGEIASPGQPIVSVFSIDRIKVTAGVPENYVNAVNRGDKAEIEFSDIENGTYNGTVSFVGNTISENNRTFPVEVLIANAGKKIKPELSAVIRIQNKVYGNAIIVPEDVVQKTDLGYVVFVEESGIAKMRNVEVISRFNNKAAIKEGLKEGDNVITVGYQNLIDGERVKVVKQ